jgi:hypothetical protein
MQNFTSNFTIWIVYIVFYLKGGFIKNMGINPVFDKTFWLQNPWDHEKYCQNLNC